MKRKKRVGVGWGLEARRAEGGQCTWDRDVPETEQCLCVSSVPSGADLGPRTRFLELGELPVFPF